MTGGRPTTARVVAVRRTGGFSGVVVDGNADLGSHPNGAEIAALLERSDLDKVAVSDPPPDRFVYELSIDGHAIVLPEQDLTRDQQRVIDLVLGT